MSKVEDFLDRIIEGDCWEIMRTMPSSCIDMVFLDPPYFLQLPKKNLIRWGVRTKVEGVNEEWDKFSSFNEYDDFIERVLIEVKRLMKLNATLWAIGTYHNIHRVATKMQDLGFWILNDIVWIKSNPMPNWLNVRFTNAIEILVWAVKDKKVKDYTFHHEIAKTFEHSKIPLSVWHIPLCSGKERIRDENGRRLHPTQKPEKLLERIILVSTNEGETVFDPMAGVGTSGVVAKRLKRHFIQIEKNAKYVKAAEERLKKCGLA